jgi:hypothetical protein
LKIVRELHGRKIDNDFCPLALKAVRQRMVDRCIGLVSSLWASLDLWGSSPLCKLGLR